MNTATSRPSLFAYRALLAPFALLALSACGGPQFAGGDPPVILLPGPKDSGGRLQVAANAPEDLPGVDVSGLVPREREQWWKLVAGLYAPCADQAVSIAQCVRESRACVACPAAARLLASRVRAGATVSECESAYAARFGPNLKEADFKGSPAKGPDDAPVTIAVWSDFGCPHCRMAMPILDAVLEKRAPNVRLVHKFYPLTSHVNSDSAARAAIAAQAQGRYWEMERLLFAHQSEQAESDLLGYATKLGLDLGKFKAEMASPRAKAMIARDKAEADKAGLTGTPFILINGREFDTVLFNLEAELDDWVALEIEMSGRARSVASAAAVAAPP